MSTSATASPQARVSSSPATPVPKGGGAYRVGAPYMVGGRMYVPEDDPHYRAEGLASWYGEDFHGRLTANGEIFDLGGISAAHPTLPLPSYARVTNLSNGRSLVVRVNDRGPYHGERIIDVSMRAAQLLGFYGRGTAWVRVEYVGRAPMRGLRRPHPRGDACARTNRRRIRAASKLAATARIPRRRRWYRRQLRNPRFASAAASDASPEPNGAASHVLCRPARRGRHRSVSQRTRALLIRRFGPRHFYSCAPAALHALHYAREVACDVDRSV